ncbi:hypothetical protein GHT09_002322 [Marmota monax]|uniref:Uncharacterized protein n=1 Tax=Marmota monax TaxID=9995 RepID=A0A834QUL6_MARMO|nr:hypothetical protein GHT09_002322 [Marmota monax]
MCATWSPPQLPQETVMAAESHRLEPGREQTFLLIGVVQAVADILDTFPLRQLGPHRASVPPRWPVSKLGPRTQLAPAGSQCVYWVSEGEGRAASLWETLCPRISSWTRGPHTLAQYLPGWPSALLSGSEVLLQRKAVSSCICGFQTDSCIQDVRGIGWECEGQKNLGAGGKRGSSHQCLLGCEAVPWGPAGGVRNTSKDSWWLPSPTDLQLFTGLLTFL